MNYLPPRKFKTKSIPKTRSRPRRTSAIKCRAHLNWVKREFECLLMGKVNTHGYTHQCKGPIDPHHVVSRGAGGGDEQVVPLCRGAHDRVHSIGQRVMEILYSVDLAATAAALWEQSPAGRAYRRTATQASQVATPPEAETLAAKSPKTDGDE